MNQLQPIEHQGTRVLTSSILAESLGTVIQIITNNFNRNKDRYTVGKHYFALEGEEKRAFLNQHQNDLGSRNSAVLYLWTEKGAWLHAKSLNTDRAWEAYEMLVDDYYRVKEASINLSGLSPQLQLLIQMEQSVKQIEQR
ncbi:ORF6N domain-containing protein, partial [Paenibacillus shunpengii]